MNNLSLVVPYYNSSNVIPRKFEEWQEYDEDVRNCLEIVIIDDGSPTETSFENHWIDTNLNIKLYKINVDIPWNECGANNLGFKMATNPWIFRSDVDWYIPNNTMRHMMNLNLSEDSYYVFPGREYTTKTVLASPYNIYVMHKNTFWRVGGYDEDCRGYYGSDLTFRHRVDRVFNINQVGFDDIYVEAYHGISDQHGLHRDASYCRNLLEEKIKSDTLIPPTCIRFDWSRVK